MKLPVLILCLCLGFLDAAAQFEQPQFHHIGPAQGMGEGYVYAILNDRQGFIWIGSYEGLYKYDGYQLRAVRSQASDPNSISSERILDLEEDKNGDIWVATVSGVNRMDRNTGLFERFINTPGKQDVLPNNHTSRLYADRKGRMWVSTQKGIAWYSPADRKFHKAEGSDSSTVKGNAYFEDANGNLWLLGGNRSYLFDETLQRFKLHTLSNEYGAENYGVAAVLRDKDGITWLGTTKGLWKLDTDNKRLLLPGFPDTTLLHTRITSLLHDGQQLWIGTSRGLYQWQPGAGSYRFYGYMPNNPNGMTNAFINSLAADRNGNLWIGTALGVERMQYKLNRITFYQANPALPYDHQKNHSVRLFQDPELNLWTWNGAGIFKSKGIGDTFVPLNNRPFPHFLETFFISHYNNHSDLLVTYSGPGYGMMKYNPDKNILEKFPLNEKLDKLYQFLAQEDRYDNSKILIGTHWGICIYSLETKDTAWLRPRGKREVIKRFCQASDGSIYMVLDECFAIYNRTSKQYEVIPFDPAKSNMFGSPRMREVLEAPDGTIWILTENGLTSYNPKQKRFKNYSSQNGLKGGNIVYSLHIDKNSRLWFVTNTQLINLDPASGKFRYFTQPDGVNTTFNRLSCCMMHDGTVMIGGTNGMIGFNPDRMYINQNKPRVVLTDFRVLNQKRYGGLLPENIKEVEVGFDENAISFEFASLEMLAPEKNEYAYYMQGFDAGWVLCGNDRRATYTNLSPGTYYFKVKSSNSDGIWNEDAILNIKVVITPLYYQTWWFRTCILLLIALVIYLFYRNRLQKRNLIQQKIIAEQNASYKSKFLTNMSHEIRTPMNAIVGLNKLLLETGLDDKQKKYAEAVQQSSENLLWIVNDILDQAKIESGKYSIVEKPFNLDIILKQIHNLFQLKAKEKGIAYQLHISNAVPLKLIGDPIRLYQILSNLITNAIKFTDKGSVTLNVEGVMTREKDSRIRFIIADTGIGIPKDKLSSIFESFSQVEDNKNERSGTGLGLTIARELAEQMGGSITVESEPGKGTTFTVELDFLVDNSREVAIETETKQNKSNTAIKVLLADDTTFNILLATELIMGHFPLAQIDTADNGKIAIEKILEKDYDIVLMDVKMPVMDGMEATRIIRRMENIQKRSIPILALTANAIPEQLAECIDAGMNDYITKPVNAGELIRKIQVLTSKA